MLKINKVLIFFIFIISVNFMIVWEVLQSKWVANNVSKVLTSYVNQTFKSDIQFSNLAFTLLPPGLEVKEVDFSGVIEGTEIEMKVKKLGVYFNLIDAFSTKFMIHNVECSDGVVLINKSKEKKKKKSEVENSGVPDFSIIETIPLKNIGLTDISINYRGENIAVKNLKISTESKSLRLRGKIENIDLTKYLRKRKGLDSLEFDANVDQYRLRLNKVKINSGYTNMSLDGEIESYLSKNISYKLSTKIKMPINELHTWLEFEKVGKLDTGILDLSANIDGKGIEYDILSDLQLSEFRTDFLYGEKLDAKIGVSSEHIKVLEFGFTEKKQELTLIKPFELYNFKSKKFVEDPIIANVRDLEFDNFLRYLRNSTEMLRGRVSGEVRFDLFKDSYSFRIEDGAELNELSVLGKENSEIIKLENFSLSNAEFLVDKKIFKMNLSASKNETALSLNGVIGGGEFRIKIPVSFIDFVDIGKISNLNFLGRGTLGLELENKGSGLKLMANTKLNDFSFEDYALEKVQASINMDIDKGTLTIPRIRGVVGDTKVAGKLSVDLVESNIEADYKVDMLSLSSAKKILAPLIGNIKISNKEFHGTWDTVGSVNGKLDISKLDLSSTLYSSNTYIYDENLDSVSAKLNIREGKFLIEDFKANKSKGKLRGSLGYDLKSKDLIVNLSVKAVPIQESSYYSRVPLNLRGNLNGDISLNYNNEKWSGVSKLKLTDSFVYNKRYSDSSLDIDLNNKSSLFKLNLFNEQISIESFLNLSRVNPKKSYVDLNLNIPNLRDIIGVFSGVDLVNNDLKGSVLYSLNFDFDPEKLKINNYNSNMKKLMFSKSPIEVNYQNPNSEIVVTDGKVVLWDTNIRGRKFYVISTGSGDLHRDYDTTTQLKIDSSILEVFNNIVYKAGGNIRGKLVYGNRKGKELYEANVTSNNLSLTTNLIPTEITKADMKLSFKNGVLKLDKFVAQLINGTFNLEGDVNLTRLVPDINLRYEFKNAGITVMDKSNLNFSGAGSLIGNNFPYTLGGDFYIQKFILINEVTDYLKGRKSIVGSDVDYLPESSSEATSQLINFNLNVVTREPIYIRNSLADLGFEGNLQILGGERDPRIIGKIDLATRRNKITFKNNEFLFTKGSVFFVDRNKYSNPQLDFVTTSKINNYNVTVKLIGPVKNYRLDLTSEPSLSQSDILSLIAFGYTEDLSNNLSDSEKESMTRAGVGSIIFDSFKINETLKNEFGLQVNLGTSISKDEGSYLSKRSEEGSSSGVGKVSSATTFEIKKKLNDAMSLSVSSTVGNSNTQKQSMNLNYNINNNVSLEGVYESKSKDDAETINDDSSVGADVKLRWSFK